ncbi:MULTISPECIES: LPXTG cell wall anchor domain-containing protein [Amycolatopsis]|uniref:LPXTG cell wall anchor domain-containing protein n=2 Tax=Amycolatopsis TaxID=1813 RepID=A0ABW5HV27_9PSEU
MLRTILRTTVLSGAVAAAVFAANPAFAAEPTGPSPSDTAAISGLLASPGTSARLAHTKFPGAAPAAAHASRAAADAQTQIPVYEPTAAFINGESDVPAALAYVASPARLADGREATVWAQPSKAGWQVINVASGNDEQAHAAAAHGGYLLHEPQVNAWYSVNGNTVTVLDGAVSGVPAGTRVTLAAYRAELQKRYGDKLPGSTYDKTGAGGGYAVPAPNTGSDGNPATALAIGGAAVAAAGGAFFLRRRSQHGK